MSVVFRKNLVFPFPFLSLPVGGGGVEGKEKLNFFVGRYLLSNWHFLRSPYQIYQRNSFYLLIIIKNNCVRFFYCTLSVALQLHDWMKCCEWGIFIQSRNSKVKESDIVDKSLRNSFIIHY